MSYTGLDYFYFNKYPFPASENFHHIVYIGQGLFNMAKFVERRRFRRFEIPGGKVKIMGGLGDSLLRPFLKQFPCLNMGIGGINFLSSKEFIKGEEFVMELYAPEEERIQLRSRVIWTNPVPLSKDLVTGCEFLSFGEDTHQNLPERMNTLRRLYARYIKG